MPKQVFNRIRIKALKRTDFWIRGIQSSRWSRAMEGLFFSSIIDNYYSLYRSYLIVFCRGCGHGISSWSNGSFYLSFISSFSWSGEQAHQAAHAHCSFLRPSGEKELFAPLSLSLACSIIIAASIVLFKFATYRFVWTSFPPVTLGWSWGSWGFIYHLSPFFLPPFHLLSPFFPCLSLSLS